MTATTLSPVRFYVCEPVLHCGARRTRLLEDGFADHSAVLAALEAAREEHPNAYLLAIHAIATAEPAPPVRVRALTF